MTFKIVLLFVALSLVIGIRSIDQKTKQHGISIKSVRLSAAGYMLDVRYLVNDPAKASLVLKKNARTYIVEEKTGAKFFVPIPGKVGPLRQIAEKPSRDKTYFMMFANPGKRLKSGDQITLVLGDYEGRHLSIQ